MAETIYSHLSPEGRTLVDEAVAHLKNGYDPATGLVGETQGGTTCRSIRNSMYLALGLLIRGDRDAADTVLTICEAVLALQMDAPGEIWHGVFRRPDDPMPPEGLFDWQQITPMTHYMADVSWERITDAFSHLLCGKPIAEREAIESLLEQARNQTIPVEWDTYEPNLREFIGMTFAMMLEHFETLFPESLVRRIEMSGQKLVEGAIERNQAGLIPLNTNIRIMYVLVLSWFGQRLGNMAWQAEALREAEALYSEYAVCHACAEFNSPTYCGVDLSTLGFWRRYCENERIREIGDALEKGIWEDVADFYNPDMRNICGPYSRCYELDMKVHTCFYDLLYWGLGCERFPWHPFSCESVINPLTVLGDVRIPESVVPRLLETQPPRFLRRQFRELSERGEPGRNNDLCTATAWISPDLMIGAMAGSRNTSYQLHSLVAFWMSEKQMGTMKLLRRRTDGRYVHMHTVLFDGEVQETHAGMTVQNEASRTVELVFDVQMPGIQASSVTDNIWQFPGLRVDVKAQKADIPCVPQVTPYPEQNRLEIVYILNPGEKVSFEMDFHLRKAG